jgi:transposase
MFLIGWLDKSRVALVNYWVYQENIKPERATMRKIEFTQEQIKQLSYESIHQEHYLVRRRMQALLLKSQGLLHKDIVEILSISETTLREYLDLYLAGGVEALKELHYQGKANLLAEKKEEIIAALEANPPATYKEAQAKIKEVTGLERSVPQVREFLKKTNLTVAK